MCKNLSELFCCCFMKTERTKKKDKTKHKESSKRGKRTKKTKSPHTTTRYGTNWETLVDKVKMSPSQIDDSMITREVNVDKRLHNNRKELIAFVLKDEYLFEEKPIGRGAFGEVYKVREKPSGEFRAVKIMRLKDEKDLSRHRFDMFKNEVFSYRKSPHKNIIILYKHFMVNDLFISFMVMEFAEGGDLLHRLKDKYNVTKRAFPENETKTYFVQIANAMHFVHSNGLIHGDLKLENVLITITKNNKEIIKVSDFGCARVAFKEEEGVIKMKRAIGTISYMAPEQLRVYMTINLNRTDLFKHPPKTYNPIRADVWSLGICLYRMLFYEYPFEYDHNNQIPSLKKMLEQMKKGYEAPERIAREISNDCKDLMRNLIEYNKNQRIDMKTAIKHNWIINSPLLDRSPVKK